MKEENVRDVFCELVKQANLAGLTAQLGPEISDALTNANHYLIRLNTVQRLARTANLAWCNAFSAGEHFTIKHVSWNQLASRRLWLTRTVCPQCDDEFMRWARIGN